MLSCEKYISFSVPIKKETINDNKETITYKIKFIDTYRFMRGIDNKDCN